MQSALALHQLRWKEFELCHSQAQAASLTPSAAACCSVGQCPYLQRHLAVSPSHQHAVLSFTEPQGGALQAWTLAAWNTKDDCL